MSFAALSLPAGPRRAWRAPLVVSAAVSLVALLVLQHRSTQLAPSASFVPAMLAVVAVLDLLSAYLLVQSFRDTGDRRDLALSWAYVWSLVVMLGYAGAFPGVVSAAPPLQSAPSVTPWLYVLWHAGFPVMLGAACAPWPARWLRPCGAAHRARIAVLSSAAWAAGAAVTVAVLVARGPDLPVIISGTDTSRMTELTAPIALPLVTLAVVLAAWGLRRRSDPGRWTVVAVWICLLDLLLTYSSTFRYSMGWYTGRTLTVLGAGVVLLAMLHDTTAVQRELRRLLDRTRSAERRHGAVLQSLSEGVLLKDLDGRVLVANQAAADLLGGTVDDWTSGRRTTEMLSLMWPDGSLLSSAERPSQRTAADGVPQRSVVVGVSGDEGPRWFSASTAPVFDDDGQVAGVVLSFTDVTAQELDRQALRAGAQALREARDEAEQSSRLKSEFLANMSHEIRTPMNGVLGMTALLLDSSLTTEQRDWAQTVRVSAESLLTVLNDVLDLAKIEAGKLDVELVPVDLRRVVEDVAGLLAAAAHDKGLELACSVDPALPRRVLADPVRLRQVVLNLLGNAVKFTEQGTVVLSAERAGDRLEVRVTDTGPGVAAGELERLFQPFAQVDSTTTRRYGGTGLGLSISRQLAELMDGTLRADSRPGEGSSFVLSLPLLVLPEQARRSPEPVSGLRLLLVGAPPATAAAVVCTAAALGVRTDLLPTAPAVVAPSYDLVLVGGGADFAALRGCGLPVVRLVPFGAASAGTADGLRLGLPVRADALRDVLQTVTGGVREAVGRSARRPSGGEVRGRLLVVEDNLVNQKVAVLTLEAHGWAVEVAGDGALALAALEGHRYDAVLMDCQMPVMDGYEATQELRRRELGTGVRTPVIALTASAMAEDRRRCVEAGMDDHLTKPLDVHSLVTVLSRWTSPEPLAVDEPAPVEVDGALDELDGALREQVLELFAEDSAGRLSELVASRDVDVVRAQSHALKGACLAVGAVAAAALAADLESAARAGQLPVPGAVEALKAACTSAVVALAQRSQLSPT